jgi:hypothetical protein
MISIYRRLEFCVPAFACGTRYRQRGEHAAQLGGWLGEARPHPPPRRERAAGLLLLLTELDMREARCGIGTRASALAGDCINAGINIAKRFGRAGCFVDFRHEDLMLVDEERGRAARVSVSVGMGPLIGIQRGV